MEYNIKHAFEALKLVESEEKFEVGDVESMKKLDKFLRDDKDNTEGLEFIVDVDVTKEDELQDSYVDKMILKCPICNTLEFREEDKVIKDEDSGLYNIEDECSHCNNKGGFELVGKVSDVKPEEEVKEEEKVEVKSEEEMAEEEHPLDESLKEGKELKRECKNQRELDFFIKFLERQGLTINKIDGLTVYYESAIEESLKEGKNPKSMSKEELEAEYKKIKDEMSKIRAKNPNSNYLKDLQQRLNKIAHYHARFGKFESLEKNKELEESVADEFAFEVLADGSKVSAICNYHRTRMYTHELVDFEWREGRGSGDYRWMNRPWQRFSFASALRDAMIEANVKPEFAKECIENSGSVKSALEYFAKHVDEKKEEPKEEIKEEKHVCEKCDKEPCECLKEEWTDLADAWDRISQEIADECNKFVGEERFRDDDVDFDDTRSWSIYVSGKKLGLPVYKFGAYRNYLGGGVRGQIQHNGREKEGTVELGEFFAKKLAEAEDLINKGHEKEPVWEKPTGVLEAKEECKEEQCKEECESCKKEEAYNLSPRYDSRQSFYGKARVSEPEEGLEVLWSYNTPVCSIDKDGNVALLRNGYLGWHSSQTTLRHVKEFLKQHGKQIGSSKELAKMYETRQASEKEREYK